VSVLSASHLTKRFGDLAVLADVSVTIARQDVVGFLGPSGCGKTTLLRILLGLETHDGGELSTPLHRAGYLPQDALLLPWKTVLGNAELPLQLQGMAAAERRGRVREALPDFGLEEFANVYPHEMSGGMRQRAALLRAVLTGSEVLVLDEPFGALDTLTRHRLQDWLADLTARLGRTVLFVTHDLEEAVVLSHRVIALSARPAVVLGEEAVELSLAARRQRLGREFLAVRDRLLALLERAEP
jgi:putative hydroxymethylpyrimidine transport system ATP-binding protein